MQWYGNTLANLALVENQGLAV